MRHSGSTRLALNHVDLITTTSVTALFFFRRVAIMDSKNMFYFDTDWQSRLSKTQHIVVCTHEEPQSDHVSIYSFSYIQNNALVVGDGLLPSHCLTVILQNAD